MRWLATLALLGLCGCGDPGDTTMDACVGGILINSTVACQMRYRPCTTGDAGIRTSNTGSSTVTAAPRQP